MNIPFITLYAATGAASLIYLTTWWQMLQLVIVSTPVATAVALGGFTAGMFLGIVMMPRIVSTRQRPAHLLATIELGIAVTSLAVLGGLRYVDNLHNLWLRAALVGCAPSAVRLPDRRHVWARLTVVGNEAIEFHLCKCLPGRGGRVCSVQFLSTARV